MGAFLILLYIAYLVGLGQAWLRLFIQGEGRPRLAWSFGLGTIVWAYAQFLMNCFNIPSRGMWLYVWQVLLVAVPVVLTQMLPLAWFAIGRAPEPTTRSFLRREGNRYSPLKLLAGILLGATLFTVVLQALAFPMHMWDSIVIYGFKAKILFLERTFKTDAFLDPAVYHFSADYPLLIPYLEAGFYRWLGHPDDRLVRLLFVAYWVAWLGLLFEGLSSRIPRDDAWIVVGVVASLPLFSNMFMGQASSGFADIPLSFYWTGFLLCGIGVTEKASKNAWVLMSVFALGCAFTKNEGITAMAVGLGLFAIADRGRQRWFWIAPIMLAVTLLLPWWWVRHLLPHNAAHYARFLVIPAHELMARLKLIGMSFKGELFSVRNWGLFWALVMVGIFWPQKFLRFPRESKIFLIAVGMQLCLYAYVYLTYQDDLSYLIPITLLRLMIHTVGPITLAIGWRLQE